MKRSLAVLFVTALALTACSNTTGFELGKPHAERDRMIAQQNAVDDESADCRIPVDNIEIEVLNDSAAIGKNMAANMTELIIKQYEAVRDGDKQAYIDTLNLKPLVHNADYAEKVSDTETPKELMKTTEYMLVYKLTGLDTQADFSFEDDAKTAATCEKIVSFTDALSPDTAGTLFDDEAVFNKMLVIDGEDIGKDSGKYTIDDSAFADFAIESGDVDGSDVYLRGHVDVLCGKNKYTFSAYAWNVGGEKGCYIYNTVIDKNEHENQSFDEVKENKEEQKKYEDAVIRANGIAELPSDDIDKYLTKKGTDFKTALDSGDFAMASSPEGLDLSGKKPEAEGDKILYNAKYKDMGEERTGIIYIGARTDVPADEPLVEPTTEIVTNSEGESKVVDEPEKEYPWFIQWRESADSDIIGQYPIPGSYDENKNVKWGEYYKLKDTDK